MSKVLCKKCGGCGRHHDISVSICPQCGQSLTAIPAFPVDPAALSAESRGEIKAGIGGFMQKCPACGAINYTAKEEERVRMCYNCTKMRIAKVKPIPYTEEEPQKPEETAPGAETPAPAAEPSPWSALQGNIQKAMGEKEAEKEAPAETVDWGDLLGEDAAAEPEISLTAITRGNLSFSLRVADQPYILGRDANQKDFLSADGRVSNEHCRLLFKDGGWYVQDHSANGTLVDWKDIGEGGECTLQEGSTVTLGHWADSPTFRISLKK